jgi:hypothetical protein
MLNQMLEKTANKVEQVKRDAAKFIKETLTGLKPNAETQRKAQEQLSKIPHQELGALGAKAK